MMKHFPPSRTRHSRFVILALGLVCHAVPLYAQEIPKRPEDLQFVPLRYEPPAAAQYRHELSMGIPVYLAQSTEVPLVNIVLTFKGGSYLDQGSMVGVARTTGEMLRRGGTESVPAETLDERFDFLAANVSSVVGATSSSVTLNCLTSNFAESLALMMDMVRNPGFQNDRLAIFKQELYVAMRQRNDFPEAILSREWQALLYGREHSEARQATEAMIQAITPPDLKRMHQQIFHPGNLIVAVSGDFEPQEILRLLEESFSGWIAREAAPDPTAPTADFAPGVYHLDKSIPQGKVYIGLRTVPRDHEDFFPLLVMNEILGGGGFTSRITNRVRSDEGLAYSAGTRISPRVHYPGEFRASFQSKNRTVALSAKIIYEEINRMRSEAVSPEELDVAINGFIETFPRTFESKPRMLSVFVSDEMTGRPAGYWENYRQKIRNVTARDLREVAQRWLDPERMAIMIVGNWDEIVGGDLEGRADMTDFYGGSVTHLPLRDPMTMDPIK